MFRMEPPPDAARPKSVFVDQKAVHQEFAGLPNPGQSSAVLDDADVPQQMQPPQAVPARTADKVGRNDLCPCGSGKKYKKCCGQ
jgi:hypothetical protein